MTNYDVVKKLIGDIEPRGESSGDDVRFENLKAMCELMSQLHTAIDSVGYNYRDSKEHSVKRASEYANEFLKNKIGIEQ